MTRPVYINGRFLTQTPTGMQRFALQLLSYWDEMRAQQASPRVPIEILVPPTDRPLPDWKTLSTRILGRGQGHVWEQTHLYRATRNGLLINLLSSGPLLHLRHIVTIHDASIHDTPQFYTFRYRLTHLIMGLALSRTARRILTGSHFSKGRLQVAFKADGDKISVIPIGCDHILAVEPEPDILARYALEPQGYFLCVGSDTPNKNIGSALRAFENLGIDTHRLVHAGARNSRVFRESGVSASDGILRLGHVSDGELRSLYENALAFIFPSRYEGFGIPPVEAMALGCPVVSSRGGSLPEVLGDAALFVDPDNLDQFSATLATLIADDAMRDRMVRAGKDRAAKFTWRAAVDRFDGIIRDFVGSCGDRAEGQDRR